MNKKKKQIQSDDFRVFVKWFWRLTLIAIVSVISIIGLTAIGAFGHLPGFAELENPMTNFASTVYSSDGEIIGKYYRENRTHVEFEEIAPVMIDALVATEDERYFDHSGIDFRAFARSLAYLGKMGGGSTITQQLAKMLFHDPPKNVFKRGMQKIKEWVIATRLERQYTKEEIITMYLNQFDFLYQAVGVHSASRIYFGISPDKLNIEQAALLVGMAKNPSLYNPKRDSIQSFNRRNVVFAQMKRNGYISQIEFDSLRLRPVVINYSKESHDNGLAPYLREYLRSEMQIWIDQNPKPDGSKYNLYTDGLKIYTSIDSRMQRMAETAVSDHIKNVQRIFEKVEKKRKTYPFRNISEEDIERIVDQAVKRSDRYRKMKAAGASSDEIDAKFNVPQKMTVYHWSGDKDTIMTPRDSIRWYKQFYQTGMLSVDPQTGYIRAWVGGVDFRYFKYDHVKMSKRQVGSTFKPFVYATALRQMKLSPCTKVPNVKVCIDPDKYTISQWCPENSENKYGDWVTLKRGLAESLNTITTYLIKQVKPPAVIQLARDLGIEAEIPEVYSIALGTVDLSVYEMAGAYTAFANKGVYNKPLVLLRIEDQNGMVLEEFQTESREVMSAEDAYVITKLLEGVTQGGTGTRLRGSGGSYENNIATGYPWAFKNAIAGKTGTTQNNSDGWFIGMVPNLITAVWSGCEDRSAHFGRTYYGQGASTALPIWANYMKAVYELEELAISNGAFPRPEGPIEIELDCENFVSDEAGNNSLDGGLTDF